ncbi:unnamed protein product, partial [marine sediment metagenome]
MNLRRLVDWGILTVDQIARAFGQTELEESESESPRESIVGMDFGAEDLAEARELMAAEDFEAGDIVIMGEDRTVRRLPSIPIGALHASMAFAPGEYLPPRGGRQYQYTEKFPQDVRDRAWKLLEQYMNPSQHFAFMEGAD